MAPCSRVAPARIGANMTRNRQLRPPGLYESGAQLKGMEFGECSRGHQLNVRRHPAACEGLFYESGLGGMRSLDHPVHVGCCWCSPLATFP